MSEERYLGVKEACLEVERPITTVRKWLRDGYVKGWKDEEGRWYVHLDSLRSYSSRSMTRVGKKTGYSKISTEEDLSKQLCPRCGSNDWERAGFSDISNGDVNIVLLCRDHSCNRRWSIRLSRNSELLSRRNAYRRGERIAGKDFDEPWEDTEEKVVRDRKRWVSEYVDQGLSLKAILGIFGANIRDEIITYYYECCD